MKYCSYAERLKRLDLITLELRRLHMDLTMCYKIVFKLIDLNFDDFFKFSPSSSTRGHPYKLYRQRGDITARENFFSQRVVNIWNNLSDKTVDFTSLNSFNRTIRLINFCHYLKCSV